MGSNIKTVNEEHVSAENIHIYLHSTGQWSWWSSYVPTINKQTASLTFLNKPTSKLKLFKK